MAFVAHLSEVRNEGGKEGGRVGEVWDGCLSYRAIYLSTYLLIFLSSYLLIYSFIHPPI